MAKTYAKLSLPWIPNDFTDHCHIKDGRPTYVACWEVIDENAKKIEVFYVGTREGAPYAKK